MRRYCSVILVLFFGVLQGCGDGPSLDISDVSRFETTLTVLNEGDVVAGAVQQGEPVILSFGFENVSGGRQSVLFTDGQQYELEVYDAQDTLVWNWGYGQVFTQALTMLSFEAGEIKTFEEIWDQTSNEGDQVPAGLYDVYVNRCWNPEMSEGPIQIEIEEIS